MFYSSLKEYKVRLLIAAILLFALLPTPIIFLYQNTIARDINAISYDNNGKCKFEILQDSKVDFECEVPPENLSNKPVSFEIEFLESSYKDNPFSPSLLNSYGPFVLTLYPNEIRSFYFKEMIDVRNLSDHEINGGGYYSINFKLKNGGKSRIF